MGEGGREGEKLSSFYHVIMTLLWRHHELIIKLSSSCYQIIITLLPRYISITFFWIHFFQNISYSEILIRNSLTPSGWLMVIFYMTTYCCDRYKITAPITEISAEMTISYYPAWISPRDSAKRFQPIAPTTSSRSKHILFCRCRNVRAYRLYCFPYWPCHRLSCSSRSWPPSPSSSLSWRWKGSAVRLFVYGSGSGLRSGLESGLGLG